jgi:hypothetical protein
MGQGDASRGANQQFDAQSLFQRIEPPPHDGRRHAFGIGSRGQAAPRGHGNKGFNGFEFVHTPGLCGPSARLKPKQAFWGIPQNSSARHSIRHQLLKQALQGPIVNAVRGAQKGPVRRPHQRSRRVGFQQSLHV